MAYFVTGATGFIGRHLVQELVDHREGTIFVLCRESSLDRMESLIQSWGTGRVVTVVGDLSADRLGVDEDWVTEPGLGAEQPMEAFLTEEPPPAEERELREEAADAAARDTGQADEAGEAPGDDEPPARRPVRKSRGRASVPSWDEIMFGGGKND